MECIAKNLVNRRLQAFTEILKSKPIDEIVKDMRDDKVISQDEETTILRSHNPAEELFIRMEKAKKAELITILDYRWSVLPWIEVELIVVTNFGMHRYLHKEP